VQFVCVDPEGRASVWSVVVLLGGVCVQCLSRQAFLDYNHHCYVDVCIVYVCVCVCCMLLMRLSLASTQQREAQRHGAPRDHAGCEWDGNETTGTRQTGGRRKLLRHRYTHVWICHYSNTMF
jgi:hypothetical protein